MRRDIYGALMNALDRGATVEQAIQSLINAGYNDIEVREAAKSINSYSQNSPSQNYEPPTNNFQKAATKQNNYGSQLQQKNMLPNTSKEKPMNHQETKKTEKKITGKIIILSIILFILLLILAGTLIFRNQIIEFLTSVI